MMNYKVVVDGQFGQMFAHVTAGGNKVATVMVEDLASSKGAWYKVENGLIASEWVACEGKTLEEAFASFISRIAAGMPTLKKALKEGFNGAEWVAPVDRYRSTISAKMADRYDI